MKSNLLKRGFLSLITTQFFGAVNDNILKGLLIYMVINGAWAGELGSGGQGPVTLLFTLPFILLSGWAGQFADRNSKRYVAVMAKIVEVPIAMLVLAGCLTGSLWLTLGALIALGCQSAFFGPAKYGMIPELVETADLSRANGLINMMTNIAVILGTVAAGIVADRYSPLPDESGVQAAGTLWLPGAVMIAVALAGLASVLFLTRLPPGDRSIKYHRNPFSTYRRAIVEMAKSPLLMVALAWGYFYLLAGLALLIVPEYSDILGITREKASRILGVMAIGIGVGSGTAGWVSGRKIEPRLIPIGAAGLTFFFILLGVVPSTFVGVSCLIFGAGFFAGFYIIPLQALLQKLSPDNERGRFLGTTNAISFAFLSVASLIYSALKPLPVFVDHPQRIFLVSAGLMIFGAGYFLLRLRHTVFGKRAADAMAKSR